jgi:DNA mismatch repair protein MutS
MPATRKKSASKKAKDPSDTPVMRQYKALKSAYPHAILFFRLGDFYELFSEDAALAAPVMGCVLTKRQGMPMCGVPYHSYQNYLKKLLEAGHKVAIAEQVEDPAQAKGIVKREVTRVVTPGTIVEDELLHGSETNYLVALEIDTVGWGLACVEVSTGEFWATQSLSDHNHLRLYSSLAKLGPVEVLAPRKAAEELRLRHLLGPEVAVSEWTRTNSETEVPAHWDKRTIWQNRQLALKAALTARSYVTATQTHMQEVLSPDYRESAPEMQLDDAAIHTLELVESADGGRKHTLWGVLDRTCTPMGSRKLKHWILHPSTELPEIERRLHCVEELVDKSIERSGLRERLESIADLERVTNRMATRSASPRDLKALRDSLAEADPLGAWLAESGFTSGLVTTRKKLEDIAKPLGAVRKLLVSALVDEPPAKLSDGGLIRGGFDKELDELRAVKTDANAVLKKLEEREREKTGIPLKVGFNSVFGYYLEISKTHTAKAPDRYTRKQTLTNAERYITPELKELEVQILGAEDKFLRLEAKLFEKLRADVLKKGESIRAFASLVAELDALHSLADAAESNGYTKPAVDLSHALEIEDGRHPIVEAALPAGTFVPNSIAVDGAATQTLVLTGPNMGGKSVYLRQNALIALMAQMGSFVPAKAARVGIVDKILTRIGAKDQLARGESTFMVEMRETSHILKAATLRSLVLLDEVGRGTSTFDGISIAWAVLEYLNRLASERDGGDGSLDEGAPRGPRVLFATHYFELTELADLLSGVKNINVEAREWTNAEGRSEVIFLHKIAEGTADRSFGIHVAELAGLPESALERAREILGGLENEAHATPLPSSPKAQTEQPSLPLFEDNPVLQDLRLLNPNDLTPLQALEKISEWKRKL